MSFTAPTRERSAPVLPLAGMVDVLFLLLVFFMTASAFRDSEQAIVVALPAAESSDSTEHRALATPITITLDADGQIFLADQPHDIDSLRSALQTLVENYPDQTVIVRADRVGQVGRFIEIIDTAYAVGLRNVQAATTKPQDAL